MTDLEFIQRCKLLGCTVQSGLEGCEYIRYSHYAEQLYKNGITNNKLVLRVIYNSIYHSVYTCSAVIALHKYGQEDILDRLLLEMNRLYIQESEHVKVWTNTYVDVRYLYLKVTVGGHEEHVEHDVFVGEKDIYFRYFTDDGDFDECKWLRVDSTGNAQHITEKYKNVVRNRKAILVTM